jgi:hypothetical protein
MSAGRDYKDVTSLLIKDAHLRDEGLMGFRDYIIVPELACGAAVLVAAHKKC